MLFSLIHIAAFNRECISLQRRIQDFDLFVCGGGGGGGAVGYVRAHTSRKRSAKSITAGVQGPPKGPGSSRVFLMFSLVIWALFLSILIQNGIQNIVDQNLRGGGGAFCTPSKSATVLLP